MRINFSNRQTFSKMFLLKSKLFIYAFLFLGLYCSIASGQTKLLSGYPLHIQQTNSDKPFIFFLTGDGGWNPFSQHLVAELQQSGYSMVALDSQQYFWKAKSPEELSKDTQTIINYYLKAWNKSEFVLIGFSFGADAGALLPTRLPKNLLDRLKHVVLFSPSPSTDLVIKLIEMAGGSSDGRYKVNAEIAKIPVPVLCVFGSEEDSELRSQIKESNLLKKIDIPGSHRYNNDYRQVAKVIIQRISKS